MRSGRAAPWPGRAASSDGCNGVTLWGKNSLFAGGILGTATGLRDVLAAKYTR